MHNLETDQLNREEKKSVAKQRLNPNSWLTKIDYINHLVLFNNVMIAILAEQGSGKTTFSELVQANCDAQIKAYLIKATVPFSKTDFLAQLDALLHLRAGKATSLGSLVSQINERKAHVLVILDDAQHLPDSFLQEALFEIKHQGEHGFFHLCLVSDFSLVASLNKLEASFIHTLEPGALTEAETKSYLLSSLPAPKRLDQTMTEKRLEQFYHLTGGNIARINSEMVSYFCPQPLKPERKPKPFVRGLSFLAGAAIALAASSYIWRDQFLPSSAQPAAQLSYPQSLVDLNQTLPSLVPSIVTCHREQTLVSQIPSWFVAVERMAVQPSPKRVVDIVLDDENDDSLVVRDRVVIIPKAIHVETPDLTALAEAETADSTLPQALLVNKEESKPESVKRQFTIQLLASPNQADIRRFYNAHPIKGARVCLTKHDDADWYVLTLGEYSQFEQAQAAVKALPMGLTRYNPWVRSLEQLKAVG